MAEHGGTLLAKEPFDHLPWRDLGVDDQYMEFVGATEHLLLSRQGDVTDYRAGMHRGWPLQTKAAAGVDGVAHGALAVGGTERQGNQLHRSQQARTHGDGGAAQAGHTRHG